MKVNSVLKISASMVALCGVGGGVTASVASCSPSTSGPQWIAHRGAPGGDGTSQTENFENITESFEKAGLQSKFMGLETDVYKTSDNKWVVCHDDNPFLDIYNDSQEDKRYTEDHKVDGEPVYINECTYAQCLTRNIVPSHNYPAYINDTYHHMNSFSDYLNICKKYNKNAIIEIKEPSHDIHKGDDVKGDFGYLCHDLSIKNPGWKSKDPTKNHLYGLWDEIEKAGMANQCYIISFQEAYIQWFYNYERLNDYEYRADIINLVENHRAQQLCSYSTTDPDSTDAGDNTPWKQLINGTAHNNDGKHYDLSLGDDDTAWIANILPITREMINYAHKYDLKFGAWTVNLKSEVNKLTKWGIDFITTDYFNPIGKLNQQPDPFDGNRT